MLSGCVLPALGLPAKLLPAIGLPQGQMTVYAQGRKGQVTGETSYASTWFTPKRSLVRSQYRPHSIKGRRRGLRRRPSLVSGSPLHLRLGGRVQLDEPAVGGVHLGQGSAGDEVEQQAAGDRDAEAELCGVRGDAHLLGEGSGVVQPGP